MLGLLVGLVVATIEATPLYAQAEDHTQTEDEETGPTLLLSRHKNVPPLPYSGPQVGPIIEPGYQDDVDRRTTAFIPRTLDMLTPLDEMPEDEE